MNSCEKYMELISAAIDGEISDADRSALEIHLEFCPECKKVMEAFSAISGSFPKETGVPDNFTAGTMAKIRTEAAKPAGLKKFISGYGKYTGLAAALVVVLLGARVFTNGMSKTASDTAAAPESNTSVMYDSTAVADKETEVTSDSAEADWDYAVSGSESYSLTETGNTVEKAADNSAPTEPEEPTGSAPEAAPEPMPTAEAQSDGASFGVTVAVTDVEELYSIRGYSERFYSVYTLNAPAPEALAELLVSSDAAMVYSSKTEHHYKVPMEQLNELDPEVFTEIVFDDLTAEYGLVILMTPSDETEDE